MQLYIGSLAGIEPAALRFNSALIFSQLENEKIKSYSIHKVLNKVFNRIQYSKAMDRGNAKTKMKY